MHNNSKATLSIEEAKIAAVKVLLHNDKGHYRGLPRTAGWGYPEPYTRDLMISSLGIIASGNEQLINSLKNVLQTIAKNQTPHGHIPSLVHDPNDLGSSDTTPLFLLATALYRKVTGNQYFLDESVEKALTWMAYQSPDDSGMVAQLPTSDWRDEQWVLGYGLYVNTIVYAYLKMYGYNKKAEKLRSLMEHFIAKGEFQHRHVHEGLVVPHKPYYSMWSYKVYKSERFDLLGNSLAVLSGLASPTRASSLISWIEKETEAMRQQGELAINLPPVLFPYIKPEDPDWRPRYEKYNKPGEYHNGGIWPFVCGFYVAAIVRAGLYSKSEKKLASLTELVRLSNKKELTFGFNEWLKSQNGKPMGQDWQTWSAAMYLYAASCVEKKSALFFEDF